MSLIDDGTSLVNSAEGASGGNYSGMITAASGLVNDLPSGDIRNAVSDVVGIAEDGLKGAAIGGMFGPWGAAIGAAIGAVIGVIEDLFSSAPPVPQGDTYRPSADRAIFPGTTRGAPFSVLPGLSNGTPRAYPDNIFYELDSDKESVYNNFDYGVTWSRPVGATDKSQADAWALARWFTANSGPSLLKRSPANIAARNLARFDAETALGGPGPAAKMMARLESLYGRADSFGRIVPWHIGDRMGDPRRAALVFDAEILDYLYYPILVVWDGGTYRQINKGGSTRNFTDVILSADTFLLAVAENVTVGNPDLVILHTLLGYAWVMNRYRERDLMVNPQIGLMERAPNSNLMRLIGIISGKIKADAARKASVATLKWKKAAGLSGPSWIDTHAAGVSLQTTRTYHAGGTSKFGYWAVGAVAAAGGVWLLTKSRSQTRKQAT